MTNQVNRRKALKLVGALTGAAFVMPSLLAFDTNALMKRKIPSSGENLPVVGLGTWQTFDVDTDKQQRIELANVLQEMRALGGAMIDSSPMYGTSERVVGDLAKQLGISDDFFYATKVWTSGQNAGIEQMKTSMRKMQRKQMDLMQIHNLVDWGTHIKTLRDWKAEGRIRYWGLTHYTNDSHAKLINLINQKQPDFVQFNYSINERHAEQKLLDVAKEKGVAVIINRPYDGGNLFRMVKGKTLPVWCADLDITSWGQYFLKYIIAHDAVNCVIPGTSTVKHVIDNMHAGYGRMPTAIERKKMLDYLKNI